MDANRRVRWFIYDEEGNREYLAARNRGESSRDVPSLRDVLDCDRSLSGNTCNEKIWIERFDGTTHPVLGEELRDKAKDYAEIELSANPWRNRHVNANSYYVLQPGDSLVFHTQPPVFPIFHGSDSSPNFSALARWTTKFGEGETRTHSDKSGNIKNIDLNAPYPVLSVRFRPTPSTGRQFFSVFLPDRDAISKLTVLEEEEKLQAVSMNGSGSYEERSVVEWSKVGDMPRAKAAYESGHGNWSETTHQFLLWKYRGKSFGWRFGTPYSEMVATIPEDYDNFRKRLAKKFQIGHWEEGKWVIGREDLSDTTVTKRMSLYISGAVSELLAQVSMQYNPEVFGVQSFDQVGNIKSQNRKVLEYRDDAGPCARRVTVHFGKKEQLLEMGSQNCDRAASRRIAHRSYFGKEIGTVLKSISGCLLRPDGIQSVLGERCKLTFEFPPNRFDNTRRLKIGSQGNFQWYGRRKFLGRNFGWQKIATNQLGIYQWIELGLMKAGSPIFLRAKQVSRTIDAGVLLNGISDEEGPKSMRPRFLP